MVFRAAVDDMAFLRGTAADESAVFDSVTGGVLPLRHRGVLSLCTGHTLGCSHFDIAGCSHHDLAGCSRFALCTGEKLRWGALTLGT